MAIPVVQAREVFIQGMVAGYTDIAEPTSFLNTFFPTITQVGKTVSVNIARGKRQIAQDILRGTDGNLNRATQSTMKAYLPPFYHELINVSELDVYDYVFNTANGMVETRALDNFIEVALSEMSMVSGLITRAINKQYADILKTGMIQINASEDIDYDRTTSTTTDAASIWAIPAGLKWTTSGNAEITLKAQLEWMRKEGKISTGGDIPVVMGEEAKTAFMADPSIQAKLNYRRADNAGIIQPRLEATGASFHGYVTVGNYNLQIWTYADSYEDEAGNDIKYVDDKDVHIIPSSFVGNTVMASVPRLPNLKSAAEQTIMNRLSSVAPGYVPDSFMKPEVSAWMVGMKAAPLALVKSKDRLGSIIGAVD